MFPRALAALLVLFLAPCAAAADAPRLMVPSGHGSTIVSVVSTSDGRWTLSASSTGEIKLWDAVEGKEMASTIVGKNAGEGVVGLLPRNAREIYAVSRRTIQLIEVPSLKLLTSIESPDEIYTASVSVDGEAVYLGGAAKNKRYIFTLRRARYPVRPTWEQSIGGHPESGGEGLSPRVSTDGKYAIYREGFAFEVMDLAAKQIVQTVPGYDAANKEVDFGAGWTADNLLAHYRFANGRSKSPMELSLYEPATVRKVATHTLPGATEINQAGIPGEETIFYGRDGFYAVRGESLEGPYKTGGVFTAGAFSPDKRRVTIAASEEDGGDTKAYQLRTFDRAKGSLSNRWSPSSVEAKIFKTSRSGNAVFLGDKERLAKIILFEQGGAQVVPISHPVEFDADFYADGENLIVNSGRHERVQTVLKTRTGAVVTQTNLPFCSVSRGGNARFLLSPSGRYLADFRIGDSVIEIQEVGTGRVVHTLQNGYYVYEEPAVPCAFSPDESSFVYFTSNKGEDSGYRLNCFSLETGAMLWKTVRGAVVGGLRFSPDGSILFVVNAHKDAYADVHALVAKTGAEYAAPIPFRPAPTYSYRPAFSNDGTRVAYPSGKDVLVFDLKTGDLKAKLSDGAQNAAQVGFLNDNQVLSLSQDGALRLWGIAKQELLGTMTFSKEGAEWAFVHPSGRFEATAASQEQMYFVQGEKRAPLSAYFEAFYTPGLIGQILAGETIRPPTVELQNLIEPPSISLKLAGAARNLTVEDAPEAVSTETVTLAIAADSPGSSVSEIRLFHNGKRIETKTRNLVVEDDDGKADAKPLSPAAKHERITVTLVPGENVFRAIALNAQRTESQPAELALEFTPAKDSAPVAGRSGGGLQLHLLIVGINTYRNPKYNLNYAVPDADAVKTAIQQSSGSIFSKVNVTTLFNETATRTAVLEAFKAIASASGPKDVFVFYYAGHGVMTSEPKPEFFLVPHEVTQLYGADETLREKAVSSADILAYSQQISAQKQLFLLDACQSAGALQSVATRGAAEEKAVAQLARASGTHWITASGSEQFATEFEKLGHGTFTYALLQGLAGKADSGDGRVTVNELKAWLETEVPELTKTHKGTPQYPASYGFGQDFPVAVVK
jgi:WD40 repeat protein